MYKPELTVVLSRQGCERAREWNRSLEELKVDTLKLNEFALGEEPAELIEDIGGGTYLSDLNFEEAEQEE
jgi:hypothetical protein